MNNFNNPYVDPYSFQGNHFNYNRNSTNSFNSHSSLIETGRNGAKRNRNKMPIIIKITKHKQQSIYTNRQIEKITGSKPIIFSPPKLNSSKKVYDE